MLRTATPLPAETAPHVRIQTHAHANPFLEGTVYS